MNYIKAEIILILASLTNILILVYTIYKVDNNARKRDCLLQKKQNEIIVAYNNLKASHNKLARLTGHLVKPKENGEITDLIN